MAEMLIVMAIMTVLAASLVVLVPRLRTSAMCKAAGADIHLISIAIEQYHEDKGVYPGRPYTPGNPDNPAAMDFMDRCLYEWLTDPAAGGQGRGWAGAKDTWEFINAASRTKRQILDPWGTPYYYVPNTLYLHGVRINDPTDDTPLKNPSTGRALPNCYGTTPLWDDFKGTGTNDQRLPPPAYFGPPPDLKLFYNATTFQLHSKGPDQRTDVYTDKENNSAPGVVDCTDRGMDPDDINNFGGGR